METSGVDPWQQEWRRLRDNFDQAFCRQNEARRRFNNAQGEIHARPQGAGREYELARAAVIAARAALQEFFLRHEEAGGPP